jgi:four helix bundle protein
MAARHYQELTVWQKAMDLAELVYTATDGFPQKEMFGLTNQIRRAGVSVPSNIAEGQGRRSVRDFVRFLGISNGSLQELETQVMIATRLTYMSEQRCSEVIERSSEVGRLINGLIKSLNRQDEI